MANIQSAKKRVRKAVRQTTANRSRISRIRSSVKKVEEAIGTGDHDAANAALKVAQPELMRGAAKGVMHRNTVSRKISRFSAKIKAL
jgi:small subunit ribosomal protein S20